MTRKAGKQEALLDIGIDYRLPAEVRHLNRVRLAIGVIGVVAACAMFLWLVLGWAGAVPSVVDVFGISGVRIPAGIAIGGLLLAAIGFNDF